MTLSNTIELLFEDRVVFKATTEAMVGKVNFKNVSPDAIFLSDPQFRLYQALPGEWWIEHQGGAVNQTIADGASLKEARRIPTDTIITVGNSSKGISKFPLKCRISGEIASKLPPQREQSTLSVDDDSPYTKYRGMKIIPGAPVDSSGNPIGSEYDLAKENGFPGSQISVLCNFPDDYFSIGAAYEGYWNRNLRSMGFRVDLWRQLPPDIDSFRTVLANSSQLWIVSPCVEFPDVYLDAIEEFFFLGHGLYLNAAMYGVSTKKGVKAYTKAVNQVLQRLFNVSINYGASASGYLYGGNFIGAELAPPRGFDGCDLTTGISAFYEGNFILTLDSFSPFKTLLTGSNGIPVVSVYDKDKRRAIWDGTADRLICRVSAPYPPECPSLRFVRNAAAWLANYEVYGK
jgi:hypothetical protein